MEPLMVSPPLKGRVVSPVIVVQCHTLSLTTFKKGRKRHSYGEVEHHLVGGPREYMFKICLFPPKCLFGVIILLNSSRVIL